ncbi:YidC/Oxa1 family insertase periplasmic domain-containing protein [Vibrio chagasii]|nr:YidC/Oxa1 family insertase periplasmic domain-containing protein [Vibrio chagasii]
MEDTRYKKYSFDDMRDQTPSQPGKTVNKVTAMIQQLLCKCLIPRDEAGQPYTRVIEI